MAVKLYVSCATGRGRREINQDCILCGEWIVQEDRSADLDDNGVVGGRKEFKILGKEGLLLAMTDGKGVDRKTAREAWEMCGRLRSWAWRWKGRITLQRVWDETEWCIGNRRPACRDAVSGLFVRADGRAEAFNTGKQLVYLFRDGEARPLGRREEDDISKKPDESREASDSQEPAGSQKAGGSQGAIGSQEPDGGRETVEGREITDSHEPARSRGRAGKPEESWEEVILQDGDILLIASDGLLDGMKAERVLELTERNEYENPAGRVVAEALLKTWDHASAVLIYVKTAGKWAEDRKGKALQEMSVSEISRSLRVSEETAKQLKQGNYEPQTREELLRFGLYLGFREQELDYWMEKTGFPKLNAHRVTDSITQFLIRNGYCGSRTLFLYDWLLQSFGKKLYQEYHRRLPSRTVETFTMEEYQERIREIREGGRRRPWELERLVEREYEMKVGTDLELWEGRENRCALAKAYLSYLIKLYCPDGLFHWLRKLGLPLEKAAAVSGEWNDMYRMYLSDEKLVIARPNRELFLAMGLYLKLDTNEISLLLEMNDFDMLQPNGGLDRLLLSALLPLEESYPAAFRTRPAAAEIVTEDDCMDLLQDSLLMFAFRKDCSRPVFLFEDNLVGYVCGYIRENEPWEMVSFRESRLYRQYLYMLDR